MSDIKIDDVLGRFYQCHLTLQNLELKAQLEKMKELNETMERYFKNEVCASFHRLFIYLFIFKIDLHLFVQFKYLDV